MASFWRAASFAVLGLAACSSPNPWDRPARFVVWPYEADSVEGALRIGVAWIPATEGLTLPVTDAVDVEAIGEDFGWEPQVPPPAEAMRHCVEIGCIDTEQAAVGWIAAFVDRDGNGTAEVQVPDALAWSASDLVAVGRDELVGLATDHAVAYAEHPLDASGGLAQTLGWPVPAELSVMRVRHADRKDLLEPVVSGERVPIYLLGATHRSPPPVDGEEGGLCCDIALSCERAGVHCPTFQTQGVAVD